MVSRHKDIKSFYKHLKKRYSDSKNAFPCEGALLNVLVYALFLENGSFEYANDAYEKISYYFIDWNEIRVSKGKEIAEVVDGSLRAELDGERLRRILQYIFDKTYEFKLEGSCKSVDEFDAFMDELPYSTRFIEKYVDYFVFGRKEVPLNEGALQILRRLNLVEVKDGKEVVPSAASKLSDAERTEFFTLIHRLGLEMASEESRDSALKFLALFDKTALKKSDAPLVASRWSSDPREIAKAISKKEKEKNLKGQRRFASPSIDEVAAEYEQDDRELEDETYSESEEEDSGVEASVTLTSVGVTVDSPKTSRSRAGSDSASAKSRKSRESALVENDFSTVSNAEEKTALVEEPTEKKRAKKSSRAKDAPEKKAAETASDVEKVVEDKPTEKLTEKPAEKPSKKAKSDAVRDDAEEDKAKSAAKAKKASSKKTERVAAEPGVASSDVDEKRAPAKKSSSKKSAKKSDVEVEAAKPSADSAPELIAKPAKKSSRVKKDAGEDDASVSKNVESSAEVKEAATSSAKRRKSTATVKRSEPPDAESAATDAEKESASKAKAKASAKKKSADSKIDAKAVDAAPAKSSRTKSASKSKSGEATKIKEIQHKKPR